MTDENSPNVLPSPPAVAAPALARPRKPSGWRNWLFRLLAMTAVPALFLVLLEVLLRLCGYGYPPQFFLPEDIDGQAMIIENLDFGRRFFPFDQIRLPVPTAFAAATKPAGTYRIFILGESAAMGFPDPAFHFGRILQAMLHERYPATRFEVVNASMSAITSHVILPIAGECVQHEPDLFILYMGNNEVVGPFGLSAELGGFSPSLPLIRANIAVRATRTGQLLAHVTQLGFGRRIMPKQESGLPHFNVSQVRADDPRLATIQAHFAANLQDICSVCRQAGAKILVCTVATNLKDSAPMASVLKTDRTSEDAAAWKLHYEEGNRLESARDHAGALASYRRALAIDDTFADLHFRLARCLTVQKQPAEAHRHYVLARDLDALRMRTDSRLNERTRATVQGREDEGIYFADVERAFANASADGTPGEELFYEHVHLTFEGNYQLAHTALAQLVRMLPDSVRPRGEPDTPFLSVQACKKRLPFTEWNRKNALKDVTTMAYNPPFIYQSDHEERLKRWRRQLDEMNERLAAGGAAQAVADYRRALERKEGDYYLHKDFALLLWEQGLLDEAVRHSRAALKWIPHDLLVLTRLAEILASQGKVDEALATCAEALRLKPDNPVALNIMGKLQMAAGKPDEAVSSSFTQALKLYPYPAEFHANLGKAWALQQQYGKALAAYQEALRLDPKYIPAHHQLGLILNNTGRPDAARHHLQEALRLDPKQAQIHYELAAVLLNQGNVDEAVIHLEDALRLRPDWPQVEKILKDLRLRHRKVP